MNFRRRRHSTTLPCMLEFVLVLAMVRKALAKGFTRRFITFNKVQPFSSAFHFQTQRERTCRLYCVPRSVPSRARCVGLTQRIRGALRDGHGRDRVKGGSNSRQWNGFSIHHSIHNSTRSSSVECYCPSRFQARRAP